MSNPFNKKNNSSVLRSFAKIAADKNLVSFDDEKLTKKASAKEDLYAGENLIENILKLANALRNRGNVVQSEELERLALQYKAASNQLYQVFKETGEDLVDLAHPEGSAKLEGVVGDAVVETIVDQKKKIEEIVKKSPTGKLAMLKKEINKVAWQENELTASIGDLAGKLYLLLTSFSQVYKLTKDEVKVLSIFKDKVSKVAELAGDLPSLKTKSKLGPDDVAVVNLFKTLVDELSGDRDYSIKSAIFSLTEIAARHRSEMIAKNQASVNELVFDVLSRTQDLQKIINNFIKNNESLLGMVSKFEASKILSELKEYFEKAKNEWKPKVSASNKLSDASKKSLTEWLDEALAQKIDDSIEKSAIEGAIQEFKSFEKDYLPRI